MRALKLAGAGLAAVLVILALVLMIGIPSGFLASEIQQRVERDTGYRLTVAGTTKVSLWPTLNVTLSKLALDPKDGDAARRLTIERVEADMTLSSVWSGHPDIGELVITRPVLHVPLQRERLPGANPPPKPAASSAIEAPAIARVTVKDGSIVFSDPANRVENHVDGIDAEATVGDDRKIRLAGRAQAGGQALKFDLSATAPDAPLDRQSIPFELALEVPGLLQGQLKAHAEARFNGSVMMINAVSGQLAGGAFNGWAAVDFASKPLVKLDLDFQKLEIATSKASTGAHSQAWSNAPIDLMGLNYTDAEVKLSAQALNIGDARFTRAAIDSRLAGGVMRTQVSNLGAYGGQISGEVTVDASRGSPTFAMRSDVAGVRALPLFASLADFDWLDGKLQAKLDLRSAGSSQQQIMSNLSGTAFTDFRDGAIRGLNVAKMIRSLTTGTLEGWQAGKDQSTDLTELSASFRLDRGRATTSDLDLVGPLVRVTGGGTVDLGTRMLAFRVEPKLVMTTEGQGRTNEPVGLGIPVAIEGTWAEPRIYPDIAGVLDNPDAAYDKLRQMGKGLFGKSGGIGDLLNGLVGGGGSKPGESGADVGKPGTTPPSGDLGETIGKLIQGLQQGTGGSRNVPAPNSDPAPSPSPQSDMPPRQDSQPMNDVLRKLFNR